MVNHAKMKKIFDQIRVVRAPRRRLSTFGSSRIEYYLITDVAGFHDRSRLRTGIVTAERPNIITPDMIRHRFDGFGKAAKEHAEWLMGQYGNALKALEYGFKNQATASRIELATPEQMTSKMTEAFDRSDESQFAILRGSDKLWQLSIMRFIVEETLSSFTANVKELEERGFFEEGEGRKRQHREVQHLLRRASFDSTLVPVLARKLRDYGLFEEYQDQFFRLVH